MRIQLSWDLGSCSHVGTKSSEPSLLTYCTYPNNGPCLPLWLYLLSLPWLQIGIHNIPSHTITSNFLFIWCFFLVSPRHFLPFFRHYFPTFRSYSSFRHSSPSSRLTFSSAATSIFFRLLPITYFQKEDCHLSSVQRWGCLAFVHYSRHLASPS